MVGWKINSTHQFSEVKYSIILFTDFSFTNKLVQLFLKQTSLSQNYLKIVTYIVYKHIYKHKLIYS